MIVVHFTGLADGVWQAASSAVITQLAIFAVASLAEQVEWVRLRRTARRLGTDVDEREIREARPEISWQFRWIPLVLLLLAHAPALAYLLGGFDLLPGVLRVEPDGAMRLMQALALAFVAWVVAHYFARALWGWGTFKSHRLDLVRKTQEQADQDSHKDGVA